MLSHGPVSCRTGDSQAWPSHTFHRLDEHQAVTVYFIINSCKNECKELGEGLHLRLALDNTLMKKTDGVLERVAAEEMQRTTKQRAEAEKE